MHTGNTPLAQISKRIVESDAIHKTKKSFDRPLLTKLCAVDVEPLSRLIKQKYNLYAKIEMEKFKIDCTRDEDQWILTLDLQILQVCYLVHTLGGKIFIYGYPLNNTHDYFDLPIRSSNLFIYSVDSLQKNRLFCAQMIILSAKCLN